MSGAGDGAPWVDDEPEVLWEPPPHPPLTDDHDPAGEKPHPLVGFIVEELGLDCVTAELIAPKLEQRITYERATSLARRVVRDQQLAQDADFAGIDVVTGAQLLGRTRPPRPRIFGDLVLEGHNVTVVGRKKVGKSTVGEDMVRAAVTGGNFLGRFPVADAMRVTYMNFELDERDMERRIRQLDLDDQALERVLVLNLRGRRLPLMTSAGRKWLVSRLTDHGTQLLVVDPFGAAYASAGGESENDNAEVRRFTTALDEIKRLAHVGTLVMPVHTGAAEHEAGEERARGATVLEDWPDVLMYLTKDKQGARFLRTDGRAPYLLHESRLGYDELAGRPMLATDDLGVNRNKAKRQADIDTVLTAVRTEPGINTRGLRDALASTGITNNIAKDTAVSNARNGRHVHTHPGPRNALLHYLGPPHDHNDPCPEGWKP